MTVFHGGSEPLERRVFAEVLYDISSEVTQRRFHCPGSELHVGPGSEGGHRRGGQRARPSVTHWGPVREWRAGKAGWGCGAFRGLRSSRPKARDLHMLHRVCFPWLYVYESVLR